MYFRYLTHTCLVVMLLVSTVCMAGSNIAAKVVIDYDAMTAELETSCISSEEFTVAIRIIGANDLTGYCISLTYDTLQLKFMQAEKKLPDAVQPSFLESKGGKPGPFMVTAPHKNTIDIVSGIACTDPKKAPDGDGVLAIARFKRLTYDDVCTLKITKAELSDVLLSIDKTVTVNKQD